MQIQNLSKCMHSWAVAGSLGINPNLVPTSRLCWGTQRKLAIDHRTQRDHTRR